jgi:cholesterol oxidase
MMSFSRRDFLTGSLSLTLASCTTIGKKEAKEEPKLARQPDSANALGYRLSTDPGKLKTHYKVVVVGSGYGASVIAARLSTKVASLCILERGKEWHPGDFPEVKNDLFSAVKGPGLNRLGLFDIAQGKDIDIICGNGLGGTSLINAAIAIRPELNLFDLPVWPDEIREDAQSGKLEQYYKKAESVLKPNPLNQIRFEKSLQHKQAALSQHRTWGELNLNIRNDEFGEGVKANENGYPQAKCVQCGNCCTGCNYGAKNTLLTNYLFKAQQNGAEIFTRVEVEKIEKQNGIYVLSLKIIPEGLGFAVRKKISADYVFLGAGAKGSTQILMRSEAKGFGFSNALGTRLSANGDVMAMAYNTDHKTNSIALERARMATAQFRPGLIISSYANYRNPSMDGDVMSQFLLLDGVVPSSLNEVVARGLGNYAFAKQNEFYGHLPAEKKKMKLDRINSDIMFTGRDAPEEGALNHSMLYFACGHDSSGGRFVYDKASDSFEYVWKDVLNEPTFKRIEGVIKEFAKENGGVFIPNPRSTVFGQKIQATHPLGGCPMASSAKDGVVNHLGKVYDTNGGFHQNLFVVDASIIPHSLSATPLLTITALAERIAEQILQEV